MNPLPGLRAQDFLAADCRLQNWHVFGGSWYLLTGLRVSGLGFRATWWFMVLINQ